MSRYDHLSVEKLHLRTKQAVALAIPTVVAGLLAYAATSRPFHSTSLLAVLVTLALTPLLFHGVWRILIRPYRVWSNRLAEIKVEIAGLRGKIASIFRAHRERAKGEHFKKAYNLAGKSLSDLEQALSVGMYREKREVFVTAFMRGGIAVRVTASIGSPYRCAPADKPYLWKGHIIRLACDEIRQYHNHPVHNGETRPSAMDFRTTRTLQSLLGTQRAQLRSLIICWNSLREWKIYEHDDKGQYWLHSEFDAATSQQH